MRALLTVLACALILSPGAGRAMAASADREAEFTPPARTLAGAAGASQQQIIDAIQKRYNATVVRVTETSVNGRPALRLRLLSAQRVFSIVVDAATGQVLEGG